jgi:hypothetical protein
MITRCTSKTKEGVSMPKLIDLIGVRIDRKIIDRKDWVKYLVLVNWHARKLGDIFEAAADAKFTAFVEDQVQRYMSGKKPHAAIESAVMNIADDYVCGRNVTLKAGDYIALRNHYQNPAR